MSDRSNFIRGMALFGRLGSWIAGPVVVAVFFGRWLDQKYDTDPWLFLLSIGAAFMISMSGIVRDSLKEIRRIESETKAKTPKA